MMHVVLPASCPKPRPCLDEQIAAAIEAEAVIVFSMSGGKDSLVAAHVVMAELDRLGHPRHLRHAIHADLGRAEWRSTARTVERQAAFLGLPLIVVRRRQGDMVDMWRQRYDDGLALYRSLDLVMLRGPWSSASQRFCTAGMKRDQIVKALAAAFPGRTVVSVIGVRRDESHGRRNAPTSSWEAKMHRADGTRGLNWNAIVDASTPDVYAYAAAHRLPMHEAYSQWGLTRVSCALCVLSSRPDMQASLACPENAPLYRELASIELRTGFSFQQASWLCDAAPHLLDPADLPLIPAAKSYAAARRAAEALVGRSFIASTKENPWPMRMPNADEAGAIAAARRLNASWTGLDLPYLTAASVSDRIGDMIRRKSSTSNKKPS